MAACRPGGGLVETYMDHRIAMSALVLGLAAQQPVRGGRFDVHRHQLPRVRRADAWPGLRPVVSLTVAMDGPAAAGKGTLARRLAAALALPYLDTGLLYRAVARRVLDAGADPGDAAAAAHAAGALAAGDLARTDLRGPEADAAASQVAVHPGVRAALLQFQRSFATGGAVLDGRDIGTVILPHADIKLFVTAAVGTRAHRRWVELRDRGLVIDEAQVLAEMQARDAQDAGRVAAPLRAAADAAVLDTTTLDADAAYARAMEIVRGQRPHA